MLARDLKISEITDRLSDCDFLGKVEVFEEIDSTNEYLKRGMTALPDKTLAVAEFQNMGKGSKGRSWNSPAGSGICMSLLLRPNVPMTKASMLTLVMAVSVANAIRNLYNLPVEIKWPNDIVYNGRKICGILTELKQITSDSYGVVIGAGINVNTEKFPPEIENRATSLHIEMGGRYFRAEIIAEIIRNFSKDYNSFLEYGDLGGIIREYNDMSATVGKEVRVLDLQGEYNAFAVSVDKDGNLLVERENERGESETVRVFADEVSVRGIYGYV